MKNLRNPIANFLANDDGQTTVEYAVMISLILSVSGLSLDVLGYRVNAVFLETANALKQQQASSSGTSQSDTGSSDTGGSSSGSGSSGSGSSGSGSSGSGSSGSGSSGGHGRHGR